MKLSVLPTSYLITRSTITPNSTLSRIPIPQCLTNLNPLYVGNHFHPTGEPTIAMVRAQKRDVKVT